MGLFSKKTNYGAISLTENDVEAVGCAILTAAIMGEKQPEAKELAEILLSHFKSKSFTQTDLTAISVFCGILIEACNRGDSDFPSDKVAKVKALVKKLP